MLYNLVYCMGNNISENRKSYDANSNIPPLLNWIVIQQVQSSQIKITTNEKPKIAGKAIFHLLGCMMISSRFLMLLPHMKAQTIRKYGTEQVSLEIHDCT